ncbi:MAG: LptF/LptG family permease [Thermodesulfobacteria bacterium]|nr:LptF/LptG family permease [Thermodesulfobacteriota bacterium]
MIIERYIASRYFSYLAMLFFGLTGLYLLIEAFETLPDFLNKGVSFLTILVYFALISPKIIYQLSPLTILLAGLLTIVTLGKSREIMAMRSIGIPPKRIFRPVMFSALLFGLLFMAMNLFVVPKAEETAGLILQMEIGKNKKSGVMVQGGKLFYRGKDSILSAEILAPDAQELSNLEWFFFTKDYKVTEFIASPTARFHQGKWHFFNGILEKDDKVIFFTELKRTLPVSPRDLAAIETPVDQADPWVLMRAVKRLRRLGLPSYAQEMALLNYFFYPLLGVSLLYMCLPIAFYRLQGGAALGLVLGTVVAFSVWGLWNMLVSMGKTGTIPPLLAAILPHMGLLAGGLWFRKNIKF